VFRVNFICSVDGVLKPVLLVDVLKPGLVVGIIKPVLLIGVKPVLLVLLCVVM
jgi:hypothetical protein